MPLVIIVSPARLGARDRKRTPMGFRNVAFGPWGYKCVTPMGFYVVFQWIIGFQPDEPNLETGVNVLMLYGIATRKH